MSTQTTKQLEEFKKVQAENERLKQQVSQLQQTSQQQQKDHIQGKVQFGKVNERDSTGKPTGNKVRGKFLNVIIYEVDRKTEEPIQTGTKEFNGKTYPQYKIAKMFRIAESSLLKVAAGESKSCNLYYSRRH